MYFGYHPSIGCGVVENFSHSVSFCFESVLCLTEAIQSNEVPFTAHAGEDVGERGTILHCCWEWNFVQPLWKSILRYVRKLGINLPQHPAIPLLGIYTKGSSPNFRNTCSNILIAAFLIIAETENNLMFLSQMWYIYISTCLKNIYRFLKWCHFRTGKVAQE